MNASERGDDLSVLQALRRYASNYNAAADGFLAQTDTDLTSNIMRLTAESIIYSTFTSQVRLTRTRV